MADAKIAAAVKEAEKTRREIAAKRLADLKIASRQKQSLATKAMQQAVASQKAAVTASDQATSKQKAADQAKQVASNADRTAAASKQTAAQMTQASEAAIKLVADEESRQSADAKTRQAAVAMRTTQPTAPATPVIKKDAAKP